MSGVLDGVDLRTQLVGHNRLELLLFRLASGQRYGINVFKVQEVIQCPPVTTVPHADPAVLGIANLRGKTVSVIDLAAATGGSSAEGTADKFVIVTEYNRRVQGFLVDAVDRIVNKNWEEILPPPAGAHLGTYLTAVTRVDDELVEILDVEKVMAEVVGTDAEVTAGIIERRQHDQQHVLVVDDSGIARRQVARVLGQIGIDHTTCRDGLEAYEQLEAWLHEGRDVESWLALVISDVEMPRMDGYSLTRAIRGHPRLSRLKVILHTSLSGIFNQSMVEKVGADDFLPKGEPDTLASLVQACLREHAERRKALD